MDKMLLVPLCFLSLIAGSFAVIGQNQCEDKTDGCTDCAETYTLSTTHLAVPVGCYKSRGNQNGNALPYDSLVNFNSGINKDMWAKSRDASQIISHRCGSLALEKGTKYFGIEYTGECYFGDEIKGQGVVSANECAQRCKWDVGSDHHMMIFEVKLSS